ncbi:hypothetical protein NQ317_018015 [Molorchus minor]|uniref:Gag-pol polyprotein n=1 Tax=Molorchus minor TaxID=1323400 RepID=A0ABQ9JSR4_9CUCU|nr:hypothetical protein NQ317_018015 [Molorchus minor]
MADLKVLNRKRGTIKARFTQFKNYLDELVGDRSDIKLDKVDLIELESRMNKIQSSLLEFEDVQRDIELMARKKILSDNADADIPDNNSNVGRGVSNNGCGKIPFPKGALEGEARQSLFGLPTSTKESATSLRNLLDMVTKHLHALEKLKISVESWDPIIIYIMTEKLDAVTHRVWEEQKPREQLPTLQQFKEFLKSRVEMLLALEKTRGYTQTSVSPSIEPSTSREQVTSESTDPVAPVPVTSVLVGKGDKKINQTEVILSTALVQVVNWQGYPITLSGIT